jgi:arylsulfatase A-like enzyme
VARRPNFLFFITDQHRVDCLGCYGHPVLKTPNIDSIAARGTRFARFYVATPVCMPNRATLMTGRMPSVHGVRSNGSPLPLQSNTFIDALRAAGYSTALMGKSHLQNFSDMPAALKRPPARPGDQVLDAEFAEARKPAASEGPYDQEHPKQWEAGRDFKMRLPFYGFEHVDLCTAHGDQVGGHYYVWLKSQRPDADALRDRKSQLPHDYVCPQAYRTPIPEELYPTSYIAEKSCAWIDRYAAADDRSQPFFMMVSFPDPHHPFTPPGRYWSLYRPQDMALPASFHHGNRPLARPVAWALAQRESGRAVVTEQAAFAVNEREAREAMALSCGMIAMIDDAVGRILAHLAARGLAEDTIVIFTTDHGDFLGDHRLLLKGPAAIAPNRRDRRHARYRGHRSRSRPHSTVQWHPGREPAAGDHRGGGCFVTGLDGDRRRSAARAPGLPIAVAHAHAHHLAVAHDHRSRRCVGRALRPCERPARDG